MRLGGRSWSCAGASHLAFTCPAWEHRVQEVWFFLSWIYLFSFLLLCFQGENSVQSRGNFVWEEYCQLSAVIRIVGKTYMVQWYLLSPLE